MLALLNPKGANISRRISHCFPVSDFQFLRQYNILGIPSLMLLSGHDHPPNHAAGLLSPRKNNFSPYTI
jgi:hypothetical protein